ncbi:hypothetical protein KPH14_006119 [Odynerus spinipes]|uniref:Uncharacterized protein n=1 Tax=Odynerus spinipes TaxID=1348599 RepID=A0AAD9RJS8_9HYME|nr:hypothetical protein KPH14_006119 [Odynerus spinipes]
MVCRWLAVPLLSGFLLFIEVIAVGQGTFARDQKILESVTGNHNVSGAPSFDLNVPRNVTTAVGQTAFLHCRVHHMGDKEFARAARQADVVVSESALCNFLERPTIARSPRKTLTALTREERLRGVRVAATLLLVVLG